MSQTGYLGGQIWPTLSVIALFATTNTVLMLLVAASRIVFVMASDDALPKLLADIHPKTKTPFKAIGSVMITAVAIVVGPSGSIDALANVAVFSIFIVYAFVNLSLIVLCYKKQEIERSFRAPGNIGKFPVLAGAGLVTSVAMTAQFSWMTAVAGSAAMASGVVAYFSLLKGRSFSSIF